MSVAVFIGRLAGFPVFRIARTGKDAQSPASMDDLVVSEQTVAMKPAVQGQISVAAGTVGIVDFPGSDPAPMVLYWGIGQTSGKCYGQVGQGGVYAFLYTTTPQIRFVNPTGTGEAILFDYFVFNRSIQ